MKSLLWVRGYHDYLMKDKIGKVCFPKSAWSKRKSKESKI